MENKKYFMIIKFVVILTTLFINSPMMLMADLSDNSSLVNSFDQETNQFLKAKELVFKGDWNQARLQLEKYLVKFPKGNYRDEALYWLAKSLNKLANNEVILNKVISLKEEAAAHLDSLRKNYSKSLWSDDGKTLRLSLAVELDLMGKYGHKKILNEFLEIQKLGKSDIKEITVNALIEMRPEAAVTLIRRMLDQEKDPDEWKEAISTLGKYFFEESQEFLKECVDHPYPEVREEAKSWIDWNEMWKIPTNLIYYGYSAEVSDRKEINRLLENKVNDFKLPRFESYEKQIVEEKVRQFFNNKLKNVKFVTNSTIDFQYMGMDISNNIQGFNFKILQGGLKKELDKIHVNASFYDKSENKIYSYYTPVDEQNEILLTMRKGNKLAIVLLHFLKNEPYVKAGFVSVIGEKNKEKPFYHSEFSNVLGCKVLSTRNSWSSDELDKEGGVEDFGQAKVKIRGKKGDWFLTGDIIVDRKIGIFIGRNAELFDINGKVVAKGTQIIVPVENPEKYEVVGKK